MQLSAYVRLVFFLPLCGQALLESVGHVTDGRARSQWCHQEGLVQLQGLSLEVSDGVSFLLLMLFDRVCVRLQCLCLVLQGSLGQLSVSVLHSELLFEGELHLQSVHLFCFYVVPPCQVHVFRNHVLIELILGLVIDRHSVLIERFVSDHLLLSANPKIFSVPLLFQQVLDAVPVLLIFDL